MVAGIMKKKLTEPCSLNLKAPLTTWLGSGNKTTWLGFGKHYGLDIHLVGFTQNMNSNSHKKIHFGLKLKVTRHPL